MTFKDELIKILKEELEILNILKKIAYEKTDIIINNEVDKLEGMTKREEELINKMGLVEEKRLQLIDNWGIDKNISISEIIDRIPESPKDQEDLIYVSNELYKAMVNIKTRNLTNKELIEDNLKWLDFNMNLILNVETPTTYGKEKGNREVKNSLFDRKV